MTARKLRRAGHTIRGILVTYSYYYEITILEALEKANANFA